MKLCFDSIDEVQAFVKQLKGTRKGKDDGGTDDAPTAPTPVQGGQPVMPPMQGFTPPQPQTGFLGPVPAVAAVNPLVPQIIAKLDGALASGQDANGITAWFRNLLGPDAAAATLDQIKQVFIPRLADAQLKQLAQQVGIAT